MRHQRELALDRLADMGVVIAVTGGPPRCDPVDQLASIAEHDATTMGASDGQRRSHRLHLRIRQPDVVEPGLIPGRPRSSLLSLFSRHSALSMPSLRTCGVDVDARMHSLDEFATAKLGELERSSLRRALVDTTRVTGIWLLRNGRRLLSFCCNDYLNLTHHPAVKEAAIE